MAPNTGPVEISFEKPETAGVQTKHDLVEHVEGETSTSSIASPAVAPLPPVEQLGLVACIKRYRYATLICVLAAVGALSDGYQVQMSGSIIALKGFIRQFGDEREDGTYKIKPQYVDLWGCKHLSPAPHQSQRLTKFEHSTEECRCYGRRSHWLLSLR